MKPLIPDRCLAEFLSLRLVEYVAHREAAPSKGRSRIYRHFSRSLNYSNTCTLALDRLYTQNNAERLMVSLLKDLTALCINTDRELVRVQHLYPIPTSTHTGLLFTFSEVSDYKDHFAA